MSLRDRLIVLAAVLLSIPIIPSVAESSASSLKPVVYAKDLENGTLIVGALGLPLGELASIRARIVESKSIETDQFIEILDVNRNHLTKPFQLMFSVSQWGNLSNRTLPLNKVLSLRVYETGGMVGIPQMAMKETVYVETVGWSFRTSIVVLYEEQ